METKRKALGKGLEQLFNNEPMDLDRIEKDIIVNTHEKNIVEIPISEIRSNPYQPREYFDETALSELAESIKEHGILQPIIVKKSIKGYELVAGERRTKASKLAGKDTIPAIIKEFSDQDMMDIALLENIQREDLSPVEIAEGFKRYIDYTNITQEELAKKFGKSRSYITNLLGLLSLPKQVRDDITQGKISMSHARVLSKMDDQNKIFELSKKIIDEGLSVRELEGISSDNAIIKRKPIKRSSIKPMKHTIYENIIREKIGNKATVSKNKLIIPFDTDADLERILEIFNIEMDA